MPFEMIRNDIVNMKVDAIVNTAHPFPEIGTGVDTAIHKAAGEKLLRARKKIGIIDRGSAAVTAAYDLPAKYVLHTVGPVWQGGGHGEEDCLYSCYKSCLELAVQKKCRSVAFPLLATGNYGFPKDQALQIAVNAISRFLLQEEMMVYLVIFDEKSYTLSEKIFRDVQSYIDAHYAEERLEEEYAVHDAEYIRKTEFRRHYNMHFPDVEVFTAKSKEHKASGRFFKKEPLLDCLPESLEVMLRKEEMTFSEALLDWIIRKDLRDPDVYKKANIDRKLFSKIRKNAKYQPKKSTAIALALALELDLEETKEFIGRAGYALTHSSKADIIIEYFIKKKNYNVFEINEVLFAYQYPLIGA